MTDLPPLPALKAQAKRLRSSLAHDGDFISHSEALEYIARQHGCRDWNTLSAKAKAQAPRGLQIGDAVHGRYLGQPFRGRVLALTLLPGARRRVTLDLDQPVDAVRFASFSNWRKRIQGVLGPDGRSAERLSNGAPQLELS